MSFLGLHMLKLHLMLTWTFHTLPCRDSEPSYGKKLAELVDNKLAQHFELDDNWKKKVSD